MKSIFKIEENFLKYLIAPYSLSIFFSILIPPLPPSFNNFSNRKKNRSINFHNLDSDIYRIDNNTY